jgi:polyprenyl-phospho-N-acetylgalactosaminyl synthase
MEQQRLAEGTWVVIPAYREAAVIAATIKDVRNFSDSIVVVDNCSLDETAEIALAAGAAVVRHPINLGQGAALQTGIAYALAHGARYVVTFDADGQHDARDIAPMVQMMVEQKFDVVLGSRFLGVAKDMHWHRYAILKLAVLFTRLTSGLKLTDVHNGLRVLSREFCETFEFRQNRMAHASEILNYIARHDCKYAEFPVHVRYTEYSRMKGQKSSHAFRIIFELIWGTVAK